MKKNAVGAPLLVFALGLLLAVSGCKKSTPTMPGNEDLNKPVIWINTFDLTFAASSAGANPAGQVLQIKNSGTSTLNYTVSSDADWISVENDSGTSTGQVVSHSVIVDKSGMTPQNDPYTAVITVACDQAYNNPQRIQVALTVSEEPPPRIQTSLSTLAFTAQQGGSAPAVQTFELANTGGGTLKFTIEADEPWISAQPASGNIKATPKNIKVSVDPAGMTVGTHKGNLIIRDPAAANSPQKVKINLTISKENPPQIVIDTDRLNFAAMLGAGNPSSQTFTVSNGGEGTLDYTVEWDAAWLGVSPTSGSLSSAQKRHTATAVSSGLAQGNYTGTITIRDANASNSPQRIRVTLDVNAPLTDNQVGIGISPGSGGNGTIVSVPVNVRGNTSEITAFGLDLTYDPAFFEFVGVDKGTLTGGWAYVDGNASSGVVTIGGIAGSSSPIDTGSQGSIAVVKLKVIYSGSSGTSSQISINNFADDISGMTPSPASAAFVFQN